MKRDKFLQSLECSLTEPETKQRGKALAACIHVRELLERDKADSAASYSASIKQQQAEEHVLAAEVRTGITTREVECVLRPDYENDLMLTIRLDRGDDNVVRERPLDPGERQQELLDTGTRVGVKDLAEWLSAEHGANVTQQAVRRAFEAFETKKPGPRWVWLSDDPMLLAVRASLRKHFDPAKPETEIAGSTKED